VNDVSENISVSDRERGEGFQISLVAVNIITASEPSRVTGLTGERS